MQSTTKPWPPVPSGTERVHDQGGGSGQQGLRAGSVKNLWVKKRRRKWVSRLKIATYNVRTLLREHIQELDEERRETRLVWDVIGISEVKIPEECFTTLQSSHLLFHSKANNGQAGVKKASSYIAQYPVLRTVQSALRFTSLTYLFTQTPFRLGSIKPYATINTRRLLVHISTTDYSQVLIYTAE